MTTSITPAEKRAQQFVSYYEKQIEKRSVEWPNRFEIELTVTNYDGSKYRDGEWMTLPQVSTCVTIRDRLTGGYLWVQWLTHVGQPGKPGSTKFLGGRYRWTSTGTERRIRKSRPMLNNIAITLVG